MAEHPLAVIEAAHLALFHGVATGGALRPFAQEIMLIECQIAGTSFRDLQAIEPALAAGALLVLQREPDNAHDSLAIKLLTDAGHHLGYVPRASNEVLARLMDAGKVLFARLEAKEWQGDWLKLSARIFLRDL